MNTRLNFLARREHGRRIRPAVKLRAAAKLSIPPEAVEFVDLELTDRANKSLSDRWDTFRVRSQYDESHIRVETTRRTDIVETLAAIRKANDDIPMLLIHEDASYTGAIQTSLHQAIDRAFAICEFDAEDLIVTSESGDIALTLEYFPDPRAPEHVELMRLNWWREDH